MAKNPAAVALGRRGGKARLEKMSPEERLRVALSGVKARMRKTTPLQRIEVARHAANARWAKLEKTVDEIKDGTKELKKIARKREREKKKSNG